MTDVFSSRMPDAIHVGIVAYGQASATILADITLPNLAGLVGEIPQELRHHSTVRIFCRPNDLAIIRRSQTLGVLEQQIRVELDGSLQITGSDSRDGYGPTVPVQNRIVRDAVTSNAALFLPLPGRIYNQGAFRFLIESLRQGHRMVLGPVLRVKGEDAYRFLRRQIFNSPDGSFALTPEEHAALLFRYWHPLNERFGLASEKGFSRKEWIFHRPDPQELFIRLLQVPPLMAWPRVTLNEFNGFSDQNLILHCCRSWHEAHVVSDGAQCLALDMGDHEGKDGARLSDFPRVDLLRQLFNHKAINDIQLVCALRTCRIHVSEHDPAQIGKWEQPLARAVDPVILLATIDRLAFRSLGERMRMMVRLLCLLGTHTLIFLLAPFTTILIRSKRMTS